MQRSTARPLNSWNDHGAKGTIEDFVARVTNPDAPDFVPPAARIAVFDNDGTLWSEKPMPVELAFILQRLERMAAENPSLRDHQPWKAAYQKDYAWLGHVVSRHNHGDNREVKALIKGIRKAFEGMSIEAYQSEARSFLQQTRHPTLERGLRECAYFPMVELLHYLAAHQFVNYIISGGDRDFMRVVTDDLYDVPAERVIGSSNALCYREDDCGGSVAYLAKPDVFDDGPAKPVKIWNRIGRRPILACGNSNGDIQMLQFAGGVGRPALRLLIHHDDSTREFDYTVGAEKALERAHTMGWTVVSIRNDWKTIFTALRPAA